MKENDLSPGVFLDNGFRHFATRILDARETHLFFFDIL